MDPVSAFLGALLAVPGIRSFLLALAIKILYHPSADPKFRAAYDDLQVELAAATDEATKRAILVRIRALRPGATA